MAASRSIHIIDDEPAVRDSLAFLLGAEGFPVSLHECAADFLTVLPEGEPLCLITDVRMPGVDGIELLRNLKEGGHHFPIIIMTGHGDVPLAVKAMRYGAMDFVEKPFDDEILIGLVRDALADRTTKPDQGSCKDELAEELNLRLASLSQRESQVLHGLVAGQTNKEIARNFDLSPRTVEVYRAKLMTKMQAGSVSELVRFAIRAGIVSG
jgi:two-component system response regulator FixJ